MPQGNMLIHDMIESVRHDGCIGRAGTMRRNHDRERPQRQRLRQSSLARW